MSAYRIAGLGYFSYRPSSGASRVYFKGGGGAECWSGLWADIVAYFTELLYVCQCSDYDAFKYHVKLGANKLETEKLFASFRPMRL